MNLETIDETALNEEILKYQKFIEELEGELSSLINEKVSLIQREIIYKNAERQELSENAKLTIQDNLNKISQKSSELILKIEKQREYLKTAQEVHKTLLNLL